MTAVAQAGTQPGTETVVAGSHWRLSGTGIAARGLAYLGLAVVLFLPWFATDFSKTCSLAVIYALMGLSLNIVVGYTGQLSLGHQGFLGLGALVTANVVFQAHLPIWLAMAFGVLATTAVALALGLVALRITGLYLSLITLVFGSAISSSLFALARFTDNNSGVKISRPSYLADNGDWYLVCVAVLLVIFYLDYRLTVSKVGRALLALKENERVAEAFGIGVTAYKLLAFALSGAIAGLAGGLYAFRGELYSEKDFQDPNGFTLALLFVVMCVVGGLGNRLGVVIAGLFFGLINELLDDLFYWHAVRSWMQHVPLLGSYYDSDVKASYLASLIGALLLLQTLIFNRGGLGAQLRPIARWMTGHRFELHDEAGSGPAAVEGSSVRA
jgi:branched-chain amino acid transport system permease protein